MREKGENSAKRAGKAAIPPDENNDFTTCYRKSTCRYRSHETMTLPRRNIKFSNSDALFCRSPGEQAPNFRLSEDQFCVHGPRERFPSFGRFDAKKAFCRMFAAAAMLFLLVGAGSSQNTTRITLDRAIDLALAHNHSLKATRTLILQNQAQEITANLRPNPTLGIDTQFIPIFSPQDFSVDNLNVTQQFDVGIGYLFERGHKRQRRLQAARDTSERRHARPSS
jgi:hypothetical protein